ncbi:MAG: type II toxin-antitoxin system RelE/ParE family toxin [Acetobacter pasteurianus]
MDEPSPLHSVCELKTFRRAAKDVGMTEDEITQLVSMLAQNPEAGDVIKGTGGCRKVRVPGRGKGKSGGYRTITFFSGPNLPLFLLTVFSKGECENLSQSECNSLAKLTTQIVEAYAEKIVKVSTRA